MSDFLTLSVLVATFASAMRLATPYLLAALGETIGQRSGVLNLGVDGVMLLGAFFAYWTVLETDSRLLGVAVGLAVGLIMGAAYAIVTLVFKAEQGISGIGIYLFGLGISELLFLKQVGIPRGIPSFDDLKIPLLGDIPHIGNMLFNHSMLVYLAGADGSRADAHRQSHHLGTQHSSSWRKSRGSRFSGVSVYKTRAIAMLVGNGMAGLAGAALTIELGTFQNNLTNGIGFIAVALVYFGAWRPGGGIGRVPALRVNHCDRDTVENTRYCHGGDSESHHHGTRCSHSDRASDHCSPGR